MSTFLERYLQGQHEEVWQELLELDWRVRENTFYSDALDVIDVIISRALSNLQLLVQRLKQLDYEFDFPEKVISPLSEEERKLLSKFEEEVGTFPLIFRKWYEKIGTVNFLGTPSKPVNFLRNISDPDYNDKFFENELNLLYDPIEINFPSNSLKYYLKYASKGEIFLEIASDAEAKAGYSGGIYTIKVPNSAIDTSFPETNLGNDIVIVNEMHNSSFVNYLRECFLWGGFPGLKNANNHLSKDFYFLTEGLLPI